MGGASYQIWGHLDERRLRPTPRPRTLVDRIFGRRPIDAPTRLESVHALLIDVPSRDFAPVKTKYLAFLRERFREPWPATVWVVDYLSSAMSIYVRGEQERESPAPRWYVQLSFSGS